MLFGRLVSGGKCSQIVFFYRDPERPFDTERPRNWGSFYDFPFSLGLTAQNAYQHVVNAYQKCIFSAYWPP